MKIIITITLLTLVMVTFEQSTQSYFKEFTSTSFILTNIPTQTERQKDTVPVIMLVCDTTDIKVVDSFYNVTLPETNQWEVIVRYLKRPNLLLWQRGYSVREKHNEAEGLLDPYMCGNCVYKDYWVHIYYLDGNKKALSKSIIVWMSQSIK